jgi:hypothetical protein
MLRKPRIPTARLRRTIQQDIWALSFWALPRARSLPMGVAIGGRRIVMVATTIPTRGHTVARIMGATVIIIQRLTMILLPALTDGNRLLMGRTARQREGLVTTRTQGPMREAHPFPLLTAVEVQPRRITPTLGPMLKPDKVRARTRSGAAPTCREGTRALPWAITQPRMERWPGPRLLREEKPPLLARSGETLRPAKLPAAICMPGTMATFTRIPVTVGRSTTMEAGIP